MTRQSELIGLVRSVVAYHRNCGISCYPDADALAMGVRALALLTDDPVAGHDTAKGTCPPGAKSTITHQTAPGAHHRQLADIRAEIAACVNCGLHEGRRIDTAGRGGEEAQLLVVGDWLIDENKPLVPGETLFGAEQDIMVRRMIEAIHLDQDQVFITNTVKCSVPKETHPSPEQIAVCSAYLKEQIEALSPLVICTMGMVAAQALTQTRKPLVHLRGKAHRYRTAAGQDIPVIVTYHPSFLLQNPEMKKGAWTDLQTVEKMLRQLHR